MTVRVLTRCDGNSADCEVEPGGIALVVGELPHTKAAARAAARDNGWTRTRDGRDLCPACQPARKDQP